MGQPAAKQGDTIVATDIHLVLPPVQPAPPVPTPFPFNGIINGGLSTDVNIMNMPAAIVGSTAINTPPHIPVSGTFVNPPTNQGQILFGSTTVFIDKQPAARAGDMAQTCNDPAPLPVGTVQAVGTVFIGG